MVEGDLWIYELVHFVTTGWVLVAVGIVEGQ